MGLEVPFSRQKMRYELLITGKATLRTGVPPGVVPLGEPPWAWP